MEKIDFKKQYKNLFNPSSKEFSLADVPESLFLMVDGQGDPNTSQSYKDAIQALYPVAYKLKFASKENPGKDYTVAPLEGLWWADDMAAFTNNDRDEWKWTLMIMQPEWISEKMFRDARNAVLKKDLPALDKIRFERFREGLSVQIMHIGSYADEAPVIERLHKEWLPQNGYIENGKHHEIYLSDPRKVAPEKLKTILRQPVKKI
ncbi:MAG: GyrI-like domain-containing protein [Calditrichaeota bacterium]|nr:GyrI-like domain-containing protein [Calditrichota bacterium]